MTIKVIGPKQRLDLNRNFPAGWHPESDQHGAGPYPTSEPDARNLVDFIARAYEYYRYNLVPHDERRAAASL